MLTSSLHHITLHFIITPLNTTQHASHHLFISFYAPHPIVSAMIVRSLTQLFNLKFFFSVSAQFNLFNNNHSGTSLSPLLPFQTLINLKLKKRKNSTILRKKMTVVVIFAAQVTSLSLFLPSSPFNFKP